MRILVLVVVMCVGVVSLSAGGKQPNLPSANSGSTTGRRIADDQTVSSAKRIPPRRVSGPIQKTVPVEGQDFVFALENRSGFGDPILQPIVMKWIPAGTFKMGSTWATDEYHLSDEEQHTVTLTQGYWMMETEVTQAMFYAVMGRRSVARSPNPKNPMEMVTWGDAYDFCREIGKNSLVMAFNNLSGFEFRLPTESEWEYACRAGTTTQVYEDYDYQYMELSEVLNVIAWWSADFPINVRQRLPNDWGLYDMLGNVAEWCSDWYDNYPSGSVTNPLGPIGGSRRVVRGGSWADNWEGLLRSAIRGSLDPVKRLEDVGFRPVLSSVR